MIISDTKSQILSSAIELFALNGYEKTTMRNIAEQVGISSASIYYFYHSKKDVLDAIFNEFKENFAQHRNEPADILKAADEKPLPEVLSMMFYTFGSPQERGRMMAITRVVLSLQYENIHAQAVYHSVVIDEATKYIVEILTGLYQRGKIKEINYKWAAFIMFSFATVILQETIHHLESCNAMTKEYEEGIEYICSVISDRIGV